jgi:hypothetical protein
MFLIKQLKIPLLWIIQSTFWLAMYPKTPFNFVNLILYLTFQHRRNELSWFAKRLFPLKNIFMFWNLTKSEFWTKFYSIYFFIFQLLLRVNHVFIIRFTNFSEFAKCKFKFGQIFHSSHSDKILNLTNMSYQKLLSTKIFNDMFYGLCKVFCSLNMKRSWIKRIFGWNKNN